MFRLVPDVFFIINKYICNILKPKIKRSLEGIVDEKEGFENHFWYLELKFGVDFKEVAILPDGLAQ